MSKFDELETLFNARNSASDWYINYREELVHMIGQGLYTLPIAAAYNAGYDEAMKKVRNETCHTLQTKND